MTKALLGVLLSLSVIALSHPVQASQIQPAQAAVQGLDAASLDVMANQSSLPSADANNAALEGCYSSSYECTSSMDASMCSLMGGYASCCPYSGYCMPNSYYYFECMP